MKQPAARRKPRQARSIEKVQRIVTAARKLLAEEGVDGFNTNRIAAAAGVGVGSVYEYFPNKQSIVDHLIEDLSREETDLVLERFDGLEDRSTAEVIEVIVALVLDMYQKNSPVYRVLWALTSTPRRVGSRPGERAVMEAIRQRLSSEAVPLGIEDLKLTCFTVFHLVEALAERMATTGVEQFGADACRRELIRVVTRYCGIAL